MILKLIDRYLRWKGFKRVKLGSNFDWVPPSVQKLTEEAYPLVLKEDEKLQTGEYKRHQVYAKLAKTLPDVNRRDIAWAIERAVWRLPKETEDA